jgi:hypothetical protein
MFSPRKCLFFRRQIKALWTCRSVIQSALKSKEISFILLSLCLAVQQIQQNALMNGVNDMLNLVMNGLSRVSHIKIAMKQD